MVMAYEVVLEVQAINFALEESRVVLLQESPIGKVEAV